MLLLMRLVLDAWKPPAGFRIRGIGRDYAFPTFQLGLGGVEGGSDSRPFESSESSGVPFAALSGAG